MQFKTPAEFISVIVLFAILFGVWQIAGEGIGHIKSQLASQPSMLTELGEPTQGLAFKARYMENERQYWVVVVGAHGWTSRSVKVVCVGGAPQGVGFM